MKPHTGNEKNTPQMSNSSQHFAQTFGLPHLDPLGKDRSLSDQAYEQVLTMIVEGDFPAGTKLPTEQVLSQRLSVSRPILRRALKQLRDDGVIVSRQGSGSFVQRRPEGVMLAFAPAGSIADIQRTFEFRAAIEGEAAYIAAARRDENHLDRLREILNELDRCTHAGELGVDADEAFHAVVCEASDNKYFAAARNSMKGNILKGMNLTRRLSLSKTRARLEMVQREHYAIFNAIVAQDADLARDAMRGHVINARVRVFEDR